ncbi:DUF1097 domain-containing protein [Ancylomarina sp. DW003]|nr:DUF1097 domain-containing protein [Ancylomarina sp. DW003]MDE5423314.1 DUF1097 domain-containing protein [Ancylomarina sp. DW003]
MRSNIHLSIHALSVGLIAAMVIYVCSLFSWQAWVVFFAWANFFLHGSNLKKSFKLLIALITGIFLALAATYCINYLSNHVIVNSPKVYPVMMVVFVLASLIIFLEYFRSWKELIPAIFLGTVLYFATDTNNSDLAYQLVLPLLFGLISGLLTIFVRTKLDAVLK